MNYTQQLHVCYSWLQIHGMVMTGFVGDISSDNIFSRFYNNLFIFSLRVRVN